MEIRKANANDEKEVGDVLFSFYNMSDVSEAKETFVSERIKGHHYIVVISQGKIVGIVTWLSHGLFKHGLCELDRICILPEARGKGAGKKLVMALIKDAKEWYSKHGSKLRKLYLMTHDDNSSAQKFYEKVGFKHEVTLKKHYYDNKDERVYSMFF